MTKRGRMKNKDGHELFLRFPLRIVHIWRVLLSLTLIITFVLLQSILRNYSSNRNNNISSSRDAKPKLQHQPPPSAAAAMKKNIVQTWYDSIYPINVTPIGTYSYVGVGSTNCQYDDECRLYFPLQDMEGQDEGTDVRNNNKHHHYQDTSPSKNTRDSNMALATKTGNKGTEEKVPNQDRIMILQQQNNNLRKQHPSTSSSLSLLQIAILLDGHGPLGHAVAHTAALSLIRQLTFSIQGENNNYNMTAETLSTIIQNVDQILPSSLTSGSGSTAIVLVQQQQLHSSDNTNIVFLANVGDSKAIIVAYHRPTGKFRIVQQTKSHKPHLKDERHRIEQAGGTVMLPNHPDESSRVLIPMDDGMQLALAMSRSLGDLEGKKLGVLTAEPTIERIEWKTKEDKDDNYQYFAILATDGIWDSIPVDEVVRQVLESVAVQKPDRMLHTCEQLVIQSSNVWKSRYGNQYRDDISILVLPL
jgi:serine/threonine protein phosphatase PrpC